MDCTAEPSISNLANALNADPDADDSDNSENDPIGLPGPSPSLQEDLGWDHRCNFVTLAMFIIDEIVFEGSASKKEIPGGAGTWAICGARLLAGIENAKKLGWIVDKGTDFPERMLKQLQSWNTMLVDRRNGFRLTTRGLNICHSNGLREFKYQTEKRRLTPEDFRYWEPRMFYSKSFHFCCGPRRCLEMIVYLAQWRGLEVEHKKSDPVIVWEPVPDLCTPAERETALVASKMCNVVTPNHRELFAFFGQEVKCDSSDKESVQLFKSTLEEFAGVFVREGIGSSRKRAPGAIVVRAGEFGALLSKHDEGKNVQHTWFPPFHQNQQSVIDPTGAGNAFLGAMAYSLSIKEDDFRTAVIWGSVAASYAVEQIGLPGYIGLEANIPNLDQRLKERPWAAGALSDAPEAILNRKSSQSSPRYSGSVSKVSDSLEREIQDLEKELRATRKPELWNDQCPLARLAFLDKISPKL